MHFHVFGAIGAEGEFCLIRTERNVFLFEFEQQFASFETTFNYKLDANDVAIHSLVP